MRDRVLGTTPWTVWIGALLVSAACGQERADARLDDRRTTAPEVALANLDAQIAGRLAAVERRPEDAALRASAVELLLARATFTGRVSDYDRAEALLDEALATAPEALATHALAARVYGALHRFDDARRAQARAGADPRVDVTLAVGAGEGLDEAYAAARAAVSTHPTFERLVALGAAAAAVGRFEEADAALARAVRGYDDVSPLPLAYAAFTRGLLWSERAGDPRRGRPFYEEAVRLLPGYVIANVHLAELEHASGERASATARLERAAARSEDPEAECVLGELLVADGETARGRALVARARDRYDALLARHPEAFRAHAEACGS